MTGRCGHITEASVRTVGRVLTWQPGIFNSLLLFKYGNTQQDHNDNGQQCGIVFADFFQMMTGNRFIQHIVTALQDLHFQFDVFLPDGGL